jgi:hypothetical protein
MQPLRLALLIAAVVLFIIAAILGFGWLGTHANLTDVIGVTDLGLATFAGSFLPV